MISEIKNAIVDSNIAASIVTIDRSHLVDPTIGIFKTSIAVIIKRPSKKDISLRYFLLGKSMTKFSEMPNSK